jgi:hypothetical protein
LATKRKGISSGRYIEEATRQPAAVLLCLEIGFDLFCMALYMYKGKLTKRWACLVAGTSPEGIPGLLSGRIGEDKFKEWREEAGKTSGK